MRRTGDYRAPNPAGGQVAARVRTSIVDHFDASRIVKQIHGQFTPCVLDKRPEPVAAAVYGDHGLPCHANCDSKFFSPNAGVRDSVRAARFALFALCNPATTADDIKISDGPITGIVGIRQYVSALFRVCVYGWWAPSRRSPAAASAMYTS